MILIENIPWKNTIFETNSFANLMKKLSLFFFLFILFASCNSTKHVAENEHLLTKNYIYVDSVRNTSGELQKYVLQKPNPRFLSLPFGVYFHNIGDPTKPKTPKEWGKKNPSTYNFIKNVFSEKQSIAYANTFIGLNNWFLAYDEPVILSTIKIRRNTQPFVIFFLDETKKYLAGRMFPEVENTIC